MANTLSRDPMVVNTYSASALYSYNINVRQLTFSGYQNATDVLEVQDKDGNQIALLKAKSDFSNVDQVQPLRMAGLLVPVTKTDGTPNPAGTLFVYRS